MPNGSEHGANVVVVNGDPTLASSRRGNEQAEIVSAPQRRLWVV